MQHMWHLVLALTLLSALAGCIMRGHDHSEGAVYSAGDMYVYPDSAVIGDSVYRPSGARYAPAPGSFWPGVATGSALADDLYARAASCACADGPLQPLDIFINGPLGDPRRAMECLDGITPAGVSIDPEGYNTVTETGLWAAAAWETYLAGGDTKWMRRAYRSLTAALGTVYDVCVPPGQVLARGTPLHYSALDGAMPGWMDATDRCECISLSANLALHTACRTASLMAATLGYGHAERLWSGRADTLREAINDIFWQPAHSRYGSYMYGRYYPIAAPLCDTRANLLCALLGIATPEMARALVTSRPALPEGMPQLWPPPAGNAPAVLPPVQALQGIAAARAANCAALLQSTGTLWALGLKSPVPSGAWPQLLLRGYLGVRLHTDGMSLEPTVPEAMGGSLTVRSLRYRDATLDVDVSGSGNRIVAVTLDSVPCPRAFIPCTLQGHHRLHITLSGNSMKPGADVKAPVVWTGQVPRLPSVPSLEWPTAWECLVQDFAPGGNTVYDICLNGVVTECLTSKHYRVADREATTVVSVVCTVPDGSASFSPRGHVCAPLGAWLHIPATAITPRRTPLHLIPNRPTAQRYIELAPRHNTRLTFYVQAPSDGDYFLDIRYSNGSGQTALRTLHVADTLAGTLVCVPGRQADWVGLQRSSTLAVPLKAGANRLSLTYVTGTILLHDINLLRK